MDIAHELTAIVATEDDAPPAAAPASPVSHGRLAVVEEGWAATLTTVSREGSGRLLYCHLLKRWLDLAVAGLLLVALSPLLALLAIAVFIDSRGPVIFRQNRVGLGGRPFRVYKFRSMDPTCTGALARIVDADGRIRHKVRNDPRVTRVGRFLRRTSLDELPQLINVLRGEMSLVGPRPELPGIVAGYAPWQHQRHLVRPGITGWWQIQGRSELPMHEHTELDLHYVQHVSLGLDLLIMRKTIRVALSGHGAF